MRLQDGIVKALPAAANAGNWETVVKMGLVIRGVLLAQGTQVI